MAEAPDDLEKLLLDVRKTISDNKVFMERLVAEALETDPEPEDDLDGDPGEGDFEEL